MSPRLISIILIALFTLSCGEKKDTSSKMETASKMSEDKPAPEPAYEAPKNRTFSNIPASQRADHYKSEPPMVIDEGKKYTATVHTTKGAIVLELDALYAPLHTNNFVFLAREGFYDGLTFHRVEPNFVIQGGDPLASGVGGPGYTMPAEIGLPHEQGAVAMARKGDQVNPDKRSSGSQFYITLQPTPFLDGGYSVFGKVVEGFEVVQQISRGDVIIGVEIREE